MLGLVFNTRPGKAEGETIYIRADGSIDPPDAPISTADNVTYTLTGNITSDADGIVVERNNVVVDGAGFTVQGTLGYPYKGIDLSGRSKVTIKNTNIRNFYEGIYLDSSSNNSISGNNITANGNDGINLGSSSSNNSIGGNTITNNSYGIGLSFSSNCNSIGENNITNNGNGIQLSYCSNNIVSENNVTNNGGGIWLDFALNNGIYRNNFVNNTPQVDSYASTNAWDDGYPSGGNFWSDYAGTDLYTGPFQNETGSDGIGDTHFAFDSNNTDSYPLMNPHTPQHDVAIMNASLKTVVGLGCSLDISVTATNSGDYPETFNVTLYANSTQVEMQPVMLEAGVSTTITFKWNTTGFACGNCTMSACAQPVPNETDIVDNNVTCIVSVHVGVPGDISGPTQGVYDGITNMRDISYLILLFTTKPSSPNWNPNADINNDATVNMRDISIAILNFNKHE